MHFKQLLTTTLVAFLPAALAFPLSSPSSSSSPLLRPRQSNQCVETCASVCYWQDDINQAVTQGYSLHQSGETVGHNKYPHAFDDREGFVINVQGPYYEFPILSSYQTYTGGQPGADRVVFNDAGELALLVTHHGASGNNFVECTAA